MSRPDLLALSPESVAALANVGLVKRAQREIAEGAGPDVSEDEAGVVKGRFKDGIVAELRRGRTLRETPCSCGSVTVCRHRVAVALAYPAWHASQARAAAFEVPSEPPSRWSPSCFADGDLEAVLGRRAMDRARATLRAGVLVELDWGDTPGARLPTCAVRFHVPRDLAYARCDCALATGCEHVAIAAWAFRRAEALDAKTPPRSVELAHDRASTTADDGAVEEATALAAAVLTEGISGLPPHTAPRFARAREALVRAGSIWPATLVDDLERCVDAYRAQSARYRAADVSSLLAEIFARARAVAKQAELPRRYLLGADEAKETLLDHVRLVSLGARIDADGTTREAELFLADPDSGVVLVLAKRWTYAEGEAPDDGPGLARRPIAARITLGSLASGQMVSKAVRRRANRSITLGTGRGGTTSVTPQIGNWGQLPASLLATSFAELQRGLDAEPPRLLRPRLLAGAVRVVAVAAIGEVAYRPGDQEIRARLLDREGGAIHLVRRFRRVAPDALETIATALAGTAVVRFVSGDVRHGPLGLEIDPIALVTDRVIVPDIDPAPATPARMELGEVPHLSPLLSALDDASSVLEEGCHLGLVRLRAEWIARARDAASHLDEVGLAAPAVRLRRLADEVKRLRDGATPEDADRLHAAVDAWARAAVRVELTREAAVRA